MTAVAPAARAAAAAASVPAGSRWFRFNLWLHRWSSLLATLPFLVLCVTGTVLIFHDEIDAALGVVPAAQRSAAPPRPLAESVVNVMAQHPGQRVLSVGFDPDEHPGVLLVSVAPAGDHGFQRAFAAFTDLATARPLGSKDLDKTFTGVLLDLHARWFLGPLGELVGALIALLVLLSLLSGLAVYAPYVRRVAFGVLRRGRGARLLQLDLHNFVGALVLGWALVVSVTGFLLGFGTIALGVWQHTELTAVQAQYGHAAAAGQPAVDVDRAYRAALAAAPAGWHVVSTIYPDTDFSTPSHYTVLLGGAKGLEERLYRVALVNAATGRVDTMRQLPWYLKAILVSQPLHFGDYGGLALKLLWTACAWLTLFITGNGAWLWWNRRRGRREARA
ncbi:PepSY-associated TM helix domain-containing protein [Fulvimonas soli]|uniref:Putative iron-regulated membrane protein n=1 Tax=Fulvimonas soli TaxID=155197 RepID=A0A316HQ69_9GAMM|nr:PepSY-associated TM helix domain-containing protein [Fulvimonas soli]PWK82721.1 putative iron-regulated membrane protein [Fulvimonas soli]